MNPEPIKQPHRRGRFGFYLAGYLALVVCLLGVGLLPTSVVRGKPPPEEPSTRSNSDSNRTREGPVNTSAELIDLWGADSTYPPYQFRPVDNYAFGVGETLKFSIGWEKIVAGHALVALSEIIEYRGRTCFRVRSTARSTRFFSTFFRVEDWAESIFDAREIIPLHFEKHLREGKYQSDRIVDFYPEPGVAIADDDTVRVPPYIQDALSLLYYVRTQTLGLGDTVFVENFSKNKSYPLEVRVVKRERIQVKAGTFNTIVVEPLLQAAGLFKHKGQLKVWLTDDRLKMPVLMKSKVIVGSIIAELEEYKLGRLARY